MNTIKLIGTEFIGNRSFFKERNIYFRMKYGKNKISISQISFNYVFLIFP